jgi:hypothetical protein
MQPLPMWVSVNKIAPTVWHMIDDEDGTVPSSTGPSVWSHHAVRECMWAAALVVAQVSQPVNSHGCVPWPADHMAGMCRLMCVTQFRAELQGDASINNVCQLAMADHHRVGRATCC